MSIDIQALTKLANDLKHLASQMQGVALSEAAHQPPARNGQKPRPSAGALPIVAKAIIDARRAMSSTFPQVVFADPPRDLLLELFVADEQGKPLAMSAACIAAAVPATTALRHIKALVQQGIIIESDDRHDGRRVFVSLSDEARESCRKYLELTIERLVRSLINAGIEGLVWPAMTKTIKAI